MRQPTCSPAPTPRCTPAKAERKGSRNDVRRKLVFDEGDAVAQLQLAFLQPLNLDDIGARRFLQCSDRGVEITMLLQEAPKLRPKLVFFVFRHFRLGRA